MKKCPFCAEEIQDEAVKCKYCGEWLEKTMSNLGQQNKDTLVGKDNTERKPVVLNKEKNSWQIKKILENKWFFVLLILLTIYIPQIIALKYNTEFAFDYPIGEEYGFAKFIGGIIAMFLIYTFLKLFQINKSLAIIISLFSMVPIVRLISAVGMFFYSKRVNEKLVEKINFRNSINDILALFFGYLAVNLLTGVISSFYFGLSISDLFRTLLAIVLIYIVYYKWKLVFNQKNFVLYIIFCFLFYFFVLM